MGKIQDKSDLHTTKVMLSAFSSFKYLPAFGSTNYSKMKSQILASLLTIGDSRNFKRSQPYQDNEHSPFASMVGNYKEE